MWFVHPHTLKKIIGLIIGYTVYFSNVDIGLGPIIMMSNESSDHSETWKIALVSWLEIHSVLSQRHVEKIPIEGGLHWRSDNIQIDDYLNRFFLFYLRTLNQIIESNQTALVS